MRVTHIGLCDHYVKEEEKSNVCFEPHVGTVALGQV